MAQCGIGSRRKCEKMIIEGLVSVNGVIEKRLGTKIDESRDRVQINGKLIKPNRNLQYVIINKPKGYVSTAWDEKARKTVVDLVKSKARLFPIGRLDIDTTGLLLLTNDGELAFRLTHPKFEVDKIYEVILDRNLAETDRKKLESGVTLEEGRTWPCTIEFPNKRNKKLVKMIIHQGWKRQIRRMFAQINYKVMELKRVGFGPLTLNGLVVGSSRHLTTQEVNQIRNIISL